MLPALILGSLGTRRTFFIYRGLSRCVWGAPVHFQSMDF
jgi:hypothetical protein